MSFNHYCTQAAAPPDLSTHIQPGPLQTGCSSRPMTPVEEERVRRRFLYEKAMLLKAEGHVFSERMERQLKATKRTLDQWADTGESSDSDIEWLAIFDDIDFDERLHDMKVQNESLWALEVDGQLPKQFIASYAIGEKSQLDK